VDLESDVREKVRGVVRDIMLQGNGQRNFPDSRISRQCQLVLVVEVRLRESNVLGSEECKLLGTQNAFRLAPRLTCVFLVHSPVRVRGQSVKCSRHLWLFFALIPPLREEGSDVSISAKFAASTAKGLRGRRQPSKRG
jgi:hypothetical protein